VTKKSSWLKRKFILFGQQSYYCAMPLHRPDHSRMEPSIEVSRIRQCHWGLPLRPWDQSVQCKSHQASLQSWIGEQSNSVNAGTLAPACTSRLMLAFSWIRYPPHSVADFEKGHSIWFLIGWLKIHVNLCFSCND
jgi:hypothetical protein